MDCNHIRHLFMNYIIYDFSKINFSELELEKIYFEYFCSFSIFKYVPNKDILSKFINYTNNNKLKLREMFRGCDKENILKFIKDNNILPDRYCILNAIISKNKILNDEFICTINNLDILTVLDYKIEFPIGVFKIYDEKNVRKNILDYKKNNPQVLWNLLVNN